MYEYIRNLRDSISSNIDILQNKYAYSSRMLEQLNLMINLKIGDEIIQQWVNSNQTSINNIDKIVRRKRKVS